MGVLGRAVRAGRPRKVTLNWDLQSEQEPTRQQLGRRLWTGPGLVFSKRGWKASVAGPPQFTGIVVEGGAGKQAGASHVKSHSHLKDFGLWCNSTPLYSFFFF